MQSGSSPRLGKLAFGVALSVFALAACSKTEPKQEDTAATTAETPAATTNAAAPAVTATPAAAAVAPDNTDTVSGAKYADFTGDATKGEAVFIACKTCHVVTEGQNRIGPSLHAVVGRKAGSIATYTYSAANKNSGITWTPEKLFQYLENPQRVVPGTKMTYPGLPDPQKRADVIAYLKTQG
ncbi:MAG: cytochrome c family protein [Sphingomonas sp. 28-66-16]|nr:MAG: cytochrome c family protein [Sphingomonas sp. 28-66-16]